jgi:mono/diheme cytochrome c family protein
MRMVLIGLALVVAGAGVFVVTKGPQVAPPSDVRVERTAARVERGRYLFETVMDCDGCHSEHDWSKYGTPVLAGRRGVGNAFPPELGLPGKIVSPNITQDRETGIGAWSDGEIIRAIREGVSRDGRALFPMMPYQSYAKLSDEDTFSLVAYLRSLAGVKNALPVSKVDFPVSFFMQSAPQPVAKVAAVEEGVGVGYGQYLVTIGACGNCHTPMERGAPVAGKEFAGGERFRIAGFEVLSANITPDVETGIGAWTEEKFMGKLRGYRDLSVETLPAATQANFTLMPWLALRNLKEGYAYLRTLKPVRNAVERHPAVASKL